MCTTKPIFKLCKEWLTQKFDGSRKTNIFVCIYLGLPLVSENKIVTIIGCNFRPFVFGIDPKHKCVDNLCSLHLNEIITTARVLG